MLAFERTDDHTSVGVSGNIEEITHDLILCIGLTHQAMKEKSPGAAGLLREAVEMFCERGSDSNKILFDHFGDSEYLKKELEKQQNKNKEDLKAAARAFGKLMRQLADEADSEDGDG